MKGIGIGRGEISTVGGAIKGLGRPPQPTNNDLDFEPIAKPYEPKGSHSSKEKVDFQYTRPPAEEKPFDKQEVQELIDSFIKDK